MLPPLPLSRPSCPLQNVGRRGVCFDNFMSAATFSDGVFMAPAGSDRFELEPVDGYGWQLRIKSRVGARVHWPRQLLAWGGHGLGQHAGWGPS